jgi:hypothetical protein
MKIEVDDTEILALRTWTVLVKLRAGHRCEECGSDEHLHAHHIDGDKTNCTLGNGQCLCRPCHTSVTFSGVTRKFTDAHRAAIAVAGRGNQNARGHKVPQHVRALISTKLTGRPSPKRGTATGPRRITDAERAAKRRAWAPGGARRIAHEQAQA